MKIDEMMHRHCTEVWSRGRVEVVDELFHPETINHWMPTSIGLPPGREGIKALVRAHRQIIPDLNLEIGQIVPLNDEYVVGRGVFTGTHTGGDYYGFRPSGRTLRWNVCGLFHAKNGLFVEEWSISDELEVLRRLSEGHSEVRISPDVFPTRHNSLIGEINR